jgi:16S rRNA (guanine966-N2)-methyltransferase
MATARSNLPPGKLRIIGGSLRGSRIDVPNLPGLRPTPDRVRETLFNWLAPVIEGATCLDLYAGTGALGIEALSRGAATVDFVETDSGLVSLLRANLDRLKQNAQVHRHDAMQFLGTSRARYDIIFLDPPFTANLWTNAAQALEEHRLLSPHALIYVESPSQDIPTFPDNWILHREGRAGAVRSALYRHAEPSVKL